MAVEIEHPGRGRSQFASSREYAVGRKLHRRHGTTYFFASQLFSRPVQRRVDALYGFVRLADEWVDNPCEGPDACLLRLRAFRQELQIGIAGGRPKSAVLRAFCDVVAECAIPPEEPIHFLDAMEQDLTKARYETYGELKEYMRGSAAAIGVMMCFILCGGPPPEQCIPHAKALGEAMQLTNFLRDVGEDFSRGRIYLPREDMIRFGIFGDDLVRQSTEESFRRLLQFEIERARELYQYGDKGLIYLPCREAKAVRVASILYSRILDRIESMRYKVFENRARTSRSEKLLVALRVLITA